MYDENPGIFPSSTPMNTLCIIHHHRFPFAHTKGDKALLNSNVDHNRISTTVIGFQIRDIMTIRYMCGPGERMEICVHTKELQDPYQR